PSSRARWRSRRATSAGSGMMPKNSSAAEFDDARPGFSRSIRDVGPWKSLFILRRTDVKNREPARSQSDARLLTSTLASATGIPKRSSAMAKTGKDVRKLAEDAGAKIIDLRFVDLPGIWQHFSLPAKEISDDLFDEGIGFDGSSIRGFQQIQESDMLLIA